MENIEKLVADAILEREKQVTICGRTFDVTPATPATLILVSELASTLPEFDTENIIASVIVNAKDAKALGKIAATLILGAKRIKENKHVRTGLFSRKTEMDWLSDALLENVTTQELAQIVTARLTDMQVGDFFGLTTSLSAANLIKQTKEVETASGEQS